MPALKYVGIEGHRIKLEDSTYCPIYTSQATADTWYKWLNFFPDQEMEKIINIFSKEVNEYTNEDNEIIQKYYERKNIADLIYKYNNLKYFTYKNQQLVEQFTKDNNLEELINEKLSYFNESERENVKVKVLKDDN